MNGLPLSGWIPLQISAGPIDHAHIVQVLKDLQNWKSTSVLIFQVESLFMLLRRSMDTDLLNMDTECQTEMEHT